MGQTEKFSYLYPNDHKVSNISLCHLTITRTMQRGRVSNPYHLCGNRTLYLWATDKVTNIKAFGNIILMSVCWHHIEAFQLKVMHHTTTQILHKWRHFGVESRIASQSQRIKGVKKWKTSLFLSFSSDCLCMCAHSDRRAFASELLKSPPYLISLH